MVNRDAKEKPYNRGSAKEVIKETTRSFPEHEAEKMGLPEGKMALQTEISLGPIKKRLSTWVGAGAARRAGRRKLFQEHEGQLRRFLPGGECTLWAS